MNIPFHKWHTWIEYELHKEYLSAIYPGLKTTSNDGQGLTEEMLNERRESVLGSRSGPTLKPVTRTSIIDSSYVMVSHGGGKDSPSSPSSKGTSKKSEPKNKAQSKVEEEKSETLEKDASDKQISPEKPKKKKPKKFNVFF